MSLLFSFSGRIGRGGWWLGQIIAFILIVVGIIVAFQLKGAPENMEDFYDSEAFEFLSYTFLPLCIWINFATTIKRYHDRGKSGLYSLVVLLPTAGSIYQLVTCGLLAGDMGSNAYGPAPGFGKKKIKMQKPKVSHAAVAGSAIPDFSTPSVSANTEWSFDRDGIQTGRVRPEPAPVAPTPVAAPSRVIAKGGFGQRGFGQRGLG